MALLPGAQMSDDAYRLIVDDVTVDATTAATRIFSRVPSWARSLMALRNRLVAPFGLKTQLPISRLRPEGLASSQLSRRRRTECC